MKLKVPKVKFKNARTDKSTKLKGFSLVYEIDQKGLKVLRDSHDKGVHAKAEHPYGG